MNRQISTLYGAVVIAGVSFGCLRNPAHDKATAIKNGDMYQQRGQYAEAIVEYRLALKADPGFGPARLKLADAYAKANDAPNAVRQYLRAADQLPHDWALQLKVGQLLLASDQFQDAKTKAQQILESQPTNIDAQLLLGNATAGLKDLDGAIADIEEALRMDPARAQSYANLGAAKMLRGRRQEAEVAFRKAVEIEPASVRAHLALANFLVHEGRSGDAASSFEAARRLDPKNPTTNRYLALYAVMNGRPTEAEPYLKTMAEGGDPKMQLALADYYIGMGRKDDARRVLTPLTGEAGTFAAATLRLATVAYADGALAAARKALEDVLIQEPKNAEALVFKARLALDGRDLEAALKAGEQAVAAAPESAAAQFILASVLATRGERDQAKQRYLEVVRLNPQVTAAHVALGRLSLLAGLGKEARSYAEEAAKQQPEDPDVKLLLARTLIAVGDVTRAESEVTNLVNRYPQAAAAQVALGKVHLAKRETEKGVRAMNRALELAPADLEALTTLVMLDVRDNKGAAARGRVEEHLSKSPDSVPLLLLAASTYISTGDAATGERLLKRVLNLDAANIRAYAMLGHLYSLQRRLEDARAEFASIAQRQPQSVPALTMIAILLDMEDKTAEAEAAYEKVLSIDPRAPIAANNLAWILAESGHDLGRALSLAQTAKSQLPEHPSINDTLGWIYFKSEMYDSAVTILQASVNRADGDAGIRYHLGLAYARTGDFRKSKTHLARALQINPSAALAGEARRVLAAIGE